MSAPLITIVENKIPVVASSDDNYAAPLGVMFISLLENTANPERFSLFIIDGGISDVKKTALTHDIEKRGASLQFLNVNSDLYADFPTCAHISAPAYYRISIPELFDKSVSKVIYLDCDLIIKDDIQQLWETPLDDHFIAAIENISNSTYKKSGLQQSDYFNSGVMVLNLDLWRKHSIADQVREFKLAHPELICTNDQCALNGVFKGQWKRLPLRWNQQSGLYRNSSQVQRFDTAGQWSTAVWSPGIIHYIGWSKPWLRPCYHPLEGEFRRYDAMASLSAMGKISRGSQTSLLRPREFISLMKKRHRQTKWQTKYKKKGLVLY